MDKYLLLKIADSSNKEIYLKKLKQKILLILPLC